MSKSPSSYAAKACTRDIQCHLQQVYGVEVSPETISNITESVMADVREWQNRPLEKYYEPDKNIAIEYQTDAPFYEISFFL